LIEIDPIDRSRRRSPAQLKRPSPRRVGADVMRELTTSLKEKSLGASGALAGFFLLHWQREARDITARTPFGSCFRRRSSGN
jgi:hypothetical protein